MSHWHGNRVLPSLSGSPGAWLNLPLVTCGAASSALAVVRWVLSERAHRCENSPNATQIQGSNNVMYMTLYTRTPEHVHPQPNTRATSGMGRDGCCLNGPGAALGVRSKVGGHVQWTTSEVTGRDVAMSAVMTS